MHFDLHLFILLLHGIFLKVMAGNIEIGFWGAGELLMSMTVVVVLDFW